MLTGRRSLRLAAAIATALTISITGTSSASGGAPSPRCAPSQLRLTLGPLVSEKTEQHTAVFALANAARSACSLDGYPTVTLVDSSSRLLPFPYGHRGDQMITAAKPNPVNVAGGGSAYFELNKNACVSFTRRQAAAIHVRLPGSPGSLSLRLPHYPFIDYCPPGDPGDGITLSPLEPTLAAAGCGSQRACGPGAPTAAAMRRLPSAGSILGTIRIPVRETSLFTARGSALFLITFPEQHATSITVERVDRTGTRRRRLPFPLAYYLMDLSAGAKGLYAGTAVVKRFTNAPDELLRIDPVTLAVRARASFLGRVAATEAGDRMWASIGDGRVVRLDPTTLRVLASRRLLSARSVAMQGLGLSKPAFGLGSLWAIVGGGAHTELVRMDPTTLAVRSRTLLARGALLSEVIADRTHVYLARRGIASVDAQGRLGRVPADANLDAAAVYRDGIVGLNDAASAIEILNAEGRLTARTPLRDLSGELAVSGDNAWFLGDAGGGNGIVHVRLVSG
jgi:hypothetical protein